VPWAVRVHVMFGGTTALFAGVVILFVLVSAMVDRSSLGAQIFTVFLTVMCGSACLGNLRRRRRSVRLLAHGRVAYATLASKTELVGSHDSKLYALRFTFEDGGVERTIELRTQRPKLLTDDRSEQIVYVPEEPEKAELVDALPGQPRVSIDGTISGEGHLVPALATLGLFCLAVLVCAFGVFAWLI